MIKSTFMAWITRMSLIDRWGLMHCFRRENVAEHSHQVAVIAHLLAVIKNERFGGDISPERAATVALYHEVSETKLQDLSNTTKYCDPAFTKEFKKLEKIAETECLNTLPEFLRNHFDGLIVQSNVDVEYKQIVKAADILSAYIKTKDELKFGNVEFDYVIGNLEPRLREVLHSMPEVKYFVEVFLDSCNASVADLAGNR